MGSIACDCRRGQRDGLGEVLIGPPSGPTASGPRVPAVRTTGRRQVTVIHAII
jgi:hypothetical protein